MRPLFSLIAVTLVLGTTIASAQGLASVRNRADFGDHSPTTYSAGVGVGYDKLNYKNSNSSDIDSSFIQGSLGATFSDRDKVSPWDLGLNAGIVNYFGSTNNGDDTDYSARVVFDFTHAFSERLKLTNNFYLSYEVEPNFGLGASTALRNGQYFYGYNNFAVSYAWSERFSTTTSYTVDAIKYDDSAIGNLEDRFSHLIAQQFSWAHTSTLKFVGEYRYRTVQYDRANSDFTTHYALAGIEKAWSERTNGSFRAGASFYKSSRKNDTAPYFEAALHHQTSDKTTLTAFTSYDFDGSELGSYGSRTSLRVGAEANYRMTKRLSLNGGMNYTHSNFAGSATTGDVSEHELSATAGIGYQLWDNVNLDATYSHTLLNSDDSNRDYTRDRISLGINANF